MGGEGWGWGLGWGWGWVWGWILRELDQPVSVPWSIATYLKTNIAKYLPGNIWQFYGRVVAAKMPDFPLVQLP